MQEQENNPLNNSNLKANNQYVVSYNSDSFFWNRLDSSVTNNAFYSSSVPSYCNNKEEEKTRLQTQNCKDSNDCKTFVKNLCDNYTYSTTIQNLQTSHTGADTRHTDAIKQYNYELLKTVNLGIGVVYLSVILYYTYTHKN